MIVSSPEDAPLVSVVILNFNGEEFVPACLRSVIATRYEPLEILFVDNASADASVQLAQAFAPPVQIIKNAANYGFMKGSNQGILRARGEIIVLLNIDTEVEPDWVAELVKVLQLYPKVGIVGCKLLYPDRVHLQHAGSVLRDNGLPDHIGAGEEDRGQFDTLREVDYATGAALAIRRSLLDQVGNLDEGYSPLYYDDSDLAIMARKLGYQTVVNPAAVVVHHETHATPKKSFRFLYLFHRSRLRFVLKNYDRDALIHRFWPYERWWWRNCGMSKVWRPLLAAYLYTLFCAPLTFWERKWGRYRHIRASYPPSLGL